MDAIIKLLLEKQGYVKGAFYRIEVGYIDLVWGDKNGGLLHLINKRDRLKKQGRGKISGIEMVKKIPAIIENGKYTKGEKNIHFDYDGYRVAVSQEYLDNKVNWVVTAIEVW